MMMRTIWMSVAALIVAAASTGDERERVGHSNVRGPVEWNHTGHVLTPAYASTPETFRILYATTAQDDPNYRQRLQQVAATVGACDVIVDYLDARVPLPPGPSSYYEVFIAYDVVHVTVDMAFDDPVAFGDDLADYADVKGCVILGAGCTHTMGNHVEGRIMTPEYAPVFAPGGELRVLSEPGEASGFDAGSCRYRLVGGAIQALALDVLETQGQGMVDGVYEDPPGTPPGTVDIACAYNASGFPRVVYANGTGGFPFYAMTGENDIECWVDSIALVCHDAQTDTCLEDLVPSGTVDTADLLFLLGEWGPGPSPADIAPPVPVPDLYGDGVVDVQDLLALVAAWGDCEATGACCLPGQFGQSACSEQLTQKQCEGKGGTYFGDGTSRFDIDCCLAMNADDCADAIDVPSGATSYCTVRATTDGNAHAACKFSGQTHNDIWFRYTSLDDDVLTISTCNDADYDTDLVVYDASSWPAVCPPGDADLLACNDDAPGCGVTSEITVVVTAGQEVLIRVGGWNEGDTGSGVLTIRPSCGGLCPGGGPEGEACLVDGDEMTTQTNGGCDNCTPTFGSISLGQPICGTTSTYLGVNDVNCDGVPEPGLTPAKDTDWFEFDVPPGGAMRTLTVLAGTEVEFAIVDHQAGACTNPNSLISDTAQPGVVNSITTFLAEGTYAAYITPTALGGVPCAPYCLTLDP